MAENKEPTRLTSETRQFLVRAFESAPEITEEVTKKVTFVPLISEMDQNKKTFELQLH